MADKRRIGDWIEFGCLGSGSFGIVKLWCHEKTKEKIALKICRDDPPINEKSRDRWRNEVDFLKRIKHPNIVQTRPLPQELAEHVCKSKNLPALCMEYCEGGDLRKTLSTAENCCGLKETMIIRVCEDIASAIQCLHNENIAHRDLKPENIVICQGENKNIYKVIDLGYAKQADQAGLCHSYVGTPCYLSPEIVKRQEYTLSVDLWSFGTLLYECCTGVRPFPYCLDVFKSISSKDQNVIAVTVDEVNEKDTYLYLNSLPEVNRLNCVLQKKFEELFRLLLDGKATRRGSYENGTRTWKDCVNEIKTTKIVEVFCIESFKQFVYELTADFSLQDLKNCLHKDTGFPVHHQEVFIHDGSDFTSLQSASSNVMAFVFNKSFKPQLGLRYEHDIPTSLKRILDDPESISKRSMLLQKECTTEAYKHCVFFIHKQITNNKCLTRGLKALVIRLLKWLRQEFTVRSENVSQRVTELKSVVDFFEQSLITDLKHYRSMRSTLKNGVARDLPDFEAWKQVHEEMDMVKILREAGDVFSKKAELLNKISTIKNNERVSKTPDKFTTQLTKRAQEIQTKYEQIKANFKSKNPEDKASCLKDKIAVVRDTVNKILKEVEKNNEELYQFLRALFTLRQELENFIPRLRSLEMKTIELRRKIHGWQQKRQEQIWQMFSLSKEDDRDVETERTGLPQRAALSSKRSSGSEILQQSKAQLTRLKETLKDLNQQELFENQGLDWSFCEVADREGTNEKDEDT